MGSLFLQKGMLVWICLFSLRLVCGYSEVAQGSVFIDGKNAIGRTDNNFICATLDWWPPEKCDYGTCAWDHASFLNLVLFSWLHFPFLVSFSTVLMCRNTLSFLTVVSESACAHLDLEMLLWCSSVKLWYYCIVVNPLFSIHGMLKLILLSTQKSKIFLLFLFEFELKGV